MRDMQCSCLEPTCTSADHSGTQPHNRVMRTLHLQRHAAVQHHNTAPYSMAPHLHTTYTATSPLVTNIPHLKLPHLTPTAHSPHSSPQGIELPPVRALCFNRMSDAMFEPNNWQAFKAFIRRVQERADLLAVQAGQPSVDYWSPAHEEGGAQGAQGGKVFAS